MVSKPLYKSVPTFRDYEDYHDAEQYTKGWNDAMHFIFDSNKEKRRKRKMREWEHKAESEVRDCKTCTNNRNGGFAGTEECHKCMWESQYEPQSESED